MYYSKSVYKWETFEQFTKRELRFAEPVSVTAYTDYLKYIISLN